MPKYNLGVPVELSCNIKKKRPRKEQALLLLWSLLGLLVTKISAATTTISAPTTLSGDQTFSDDIVIESGATLALVSGSSYSFNGNINVKGSLDIIGDSTNGLTSLQFGSTTTITNSGNINIENIKSTGSASDFVIAPASIDNSGIFTVSQLNAAATIPGTNFTIAPTGSFINTGTIDYDTADKGGTTNGFLYLGAITNNGVIKSGGFAGLINEASYLIPSRYDMKGIIFNNPIEGQGEVTGNQGSIVLINTNNIGEQTFNVYKGMYIINPKIVPSSLIVKNSIESMIVFLGVDYYPWYAKNFNTLPGSLQINFAIDGHRYWFNTSCDGGWQTQNNPFVVTPSDPQYQIGGTFIYIQQFYYFPNCAWISEPITKTTTVTTEGSITEATTISTVTTSTTNQYGYTVTEIIYDVAVPAESTVYTTTTGTVSVPTTSTFTTVVTNSNGSSSTEVVVVVITPAPSTLSTTTTGAVTVPTTSTFTTVVTNSNGSSSTEVVVVVITPAPSTLSTTTTGAVTVPTTSTFTTVVTNSNGSSSTEVVVVVITPAPSTLSTTTTGAVTVPTTSTFTTVVTNSNGSSSTEVVVVVVITPAPSTLSTTTTGAVTVPTTSTFTTVVTNSNGSSSTEVVVVVITPAPSTLSTTTTGAVTVPTTSTFTTVVTNSNGSSSTEVVVVVITPAPSTLSTTTTGAVTVPTTSTFTTVVTNSNGSSSTEVVVVVITPAPSTLSTTTTGAVTVPTTSTFTTVVTNSNGSSSTEVVVVVITPAPSNSFMSSSISISSPLYKNSTISSEKPGPILTDTLVVLTTVVNGVTITTTYCPEPSATSEISMTTIIGHSSIELVYSKNQQEETNSFTTATNVTPAASIVSATIGSAFANGENQLTSKNSRASTTVVIESTKDKEDVTSETGTVVGTVESRKPETSPTTMVPQVSQYIPEQLSSSSTGVTVSHEGVPSLVSYEGKGGTIYVKWI
ncbi:hypothetical protein RI543_000469 [Arxiozyma heterogenica]|uniref:Hyphally-regulated cell wall protein N-terminal domain-containing protein n=1 Tax=Arxiozyma heterogenica TaxID=278026 RepID=A0AAN7WQ00_9SACH|nr:hypothetical protein RI543_000469 [Kazachstania heterogenica]